MIRGSELSDLNTIIELKIRMFEEANLCHLLNENAREMINNTYLEMLQNNRMKHFLIEVDNEIVAIAGAFIKDEIPYCFYKTPFYGFIGDVYVKQGHRRKGFAKKLTQEAINWLKKKDVKMIKLLATSEAEGIYKYFGFKNTTEMTLTFEE